MMKYRVCCELTHEILLSRRGQYKPLSARLGIAQRDRETYHLALFVGGHDWLGRARMRLDDPKKNFQEIAEALS